METAAPISEPVVARRRMPLKAMLGIAGLAVLTVLLTWRAKVLEDILQLEREEPALVSQAAPEFTLATLDGRTVSLKDFRGKKNVVVSFWASWCGPCRLEMPALIDFYKRNHNDSSDFEILAVSIDEDPKEASAFATTQKLNFPVLLDTDQKIAKAYQVEGIPTMFIIDKGGRITHGHVGYDMALPYRLPQELGVQDKKSAKGATDGDSGP
jgi:peroxiredoxin